MGKLFWEKQLKLYLVIDFSAQGSGGLRHRSRAVPHLAAQPFGAVLAGSQARTTGLQKTGITFAAAAKAPF